jgi:hypothetical protein
LRVADVPNRVRQFEPARVNSTQRCRFLIVRQRDLIVPKIAFELRHAFEGDDEILRRSGRPRGDHRPPVKVARIAKTSLTPRNHRALDKVGRRLTHLLLRPYARLPNARHQRARIMIEER